jgi:outer membrane receptor protein involved in Fe transport
MKKLVSFSSARVFRGRVFFFGTIVILIIPTLVHATELATGMGAGRYDPIAPFSLPIAQPAPDAPVVRLAQAATQASPAAQPPLGFQSGSEVPAGDKIIVTGSRVSRVGFDTVEPASVVTRERMEEQGLTNIADAFRVPGFSAGVNPESGQSFYGVGLNFVNRLGLGTARTLTLINGRRVVSSNTPSIFGPASPGLQVDLNIIPVQMVERVENLTIGGAPTYGVAPAKFISQHSSA